MKESILQVTAIKKTFGSVKAVDKLSFEIERGEIYAILGPNGAGKTTMIRMLMGIIRPDEGRIVYTLHGDAAADPRPVELGYLPEDRGLYLDIPIIKTLVYMAVIRGMERRQARRNAEEWLEKLDLKDRMGERLDLLSKGNQQKVQFIASILHEPLLAVLDEPFSGLDPVNQDLFVDLLEELRKGGTTILLSGHQMHLVERLADRVLLIDQGREVMHDTLEQIKSEASASSRITLQIDGDPDATLLDAVPGVAYVEKSAAGELHIYLDAAAPLNSLLAAVASKMEIRAIRSTEPNLHEIYVRKIAEHQASIEEENR